MKTRIFEAAAVVGLFLSAVGGLASAGQSYDCKIIARTQTPIKGWVPLSIKGNPTINNNGHIAFVAIVQSGGEALVRWNGTGYDVLSVAFNGTYGSAAIDDSDRVATSYSATSGGNSVSTIRRYSGPDVFDTLQYAGNLQVNGTFVYPYASFLQNVAMSSIGTVVYGAVNHAGWTYVGANSSAIEVHSTPFPVIAENAERVLLRPLAQDNSPILACRASNLGVPEANVVSSGDFVKTGQWPGISEDGTLVAFYGEPTVGGPARAGIYICQKTASGWQAPQLIASGGDGFTSFETDSAVGITYAQCRFQSVILAYVATKVGRKGLYTSQLTLPPAGGNAYTLEPPTLVCGETATLNGLSGSVSAVAIHVPLNANGQVAFWVQTDAPQQAIVLASPRFGGFHQGAAGQEDGVPAQFGLSLTPARIAELNQQCGCNIVGTGKASTSDFGCHLCATASMLRSFGLDTDPERLDSALATVSGYACRALLDPCKVFQASGRIVDLVETKEVLDSTDLDAYLDNQVCHQGARVILHLNEWKNSVPSTDGHFVFVVGKSGTDWLVFDPGWQNANPAELLTSLRGHYVGFKTDQTFRSFPSVRKVLTYWRVQGPQERLIIRGKSPIEVLVRDPLGRRLGAESAAGTNYSEIPGAMYLRDTPVADDVGDMGGEGEKTGTKTAYITAPQPGTFVAQVTGTQLGTYTLEAEVLGPGGASKVTTFTGTTDVGVVSNYSMVFPVIGTADLVASEVASTNVVSLGSNLSYTIGIFNLGPSNATAVTLVDTLPQYVNFVAGGASQGTVTQSYGVVRCSLGDLPVGGGATVTVVVTPTAARSLTNIVRLMGFESDPNPTNNTATTIVLVLGTNPPPIAVSDSATTTNGMPVMINVLANDISTIGILDPTTATITRAPTNGSAVVNSDTGAITYTPNPGATNIDHFAYTVQDDLGAPSNEAMVSITNYGTPAPWTLSLAPYAAGNPITSGATDHRYPRINNLGDIVYQEQIGGLWQVIRRMAGQSAVPATAVQGSYHQAQSPAIADDGRFICYRNSTNSSLPRDIRIYPNPAVALTNSSPTLVYSSHEVHNEYRNEVWECQTDPSLTSDGKQAWGYDHSFGTISGNGGADSSLNVGNQSVFSTSDLTQWNHPDANADGQFVYTRNNQVFFGTNALATGQSASINDVPRDNPDIVYANGTSLYSTLFGLLHTDTPGEISGNWVDINKNGVLVFEKQVGGYNQVFKAFPWEVRIVSTGGTNGIVGLPYRYDGDNIAEAYGAPEYSSDDPRGFLDLEWWLVSGPPGFTIEPTTGRIQWVPTAPGTYTAVIRVDTMNPVYGIYTEDTQTLTISVVQPTFEVVDAVDFRTPGTPDLPMAATNYVSGGTARIGAVADGASRLLLRVRLLGADTNSFPALHFAITGTNSAYDGFLRPIMGMNWGVDVPATVASGGGKNMAMALYQAPLDLDVASQPVCIALLSGTNLIASQVLALRRPPVVLVHDGWSGPEVWPVLISELLDAGMDVYPVDYSFTAASAFDANESKIFFKNGEALGAVKQSGFAASRVDVVAHGTGGILARVHAQRYSAQDYNYRMGDVHKLITIGTPHAGSWLDGVLAQLRTNSPSVWTNLRSAVLAASEADGRYPALDIDAGLVTNVAPGSSALAELEMLPLPTHAIVTGNDTLPPGDLYSFIEVCLGLTNGAAGMAPSPALAP